VQLVNSKRCNLFRNFSNLFRISLLGSLKQKHMLQAMLDYVCITVF